MRSYRKIFIICRLSDRYRGDRFILNKRREYCILNMKRHTETEGYIEEIWV